MTTQYISLLILSLFIIVLTIINKVYEPQFIWLDQNLYLFYSIKEDKEIIRKCKKII